MGSGRDSSWTWAPDLSTVCPIAHCCFPKLLVLPRTTSQHPKTSFCLQDWFLLVPPGAVHSVGAVIAVPQGDSAHQCEQGRKATREAPQSLHPDFSVPFVQVWGCRGGRGELLCFSRFSISEFFHVFLLSREYRGRFPRLCWAVGTQQDPARSCLNTQPVTCAVLGEGCRLAEVFFFSCWPWFLPSPPAPGVCQCVRFCDPSRGFSFLRSPVAGTAAGPHPKPLSGLCPSLLVSSIQ